MKRAIRRIDAWLKAKSRWRLCAHAPFCVPPHAGVGGPQTVACSRQDRATHLIPLEPSVERDFVIKGGAQMRALNRRAMLDRADGALVAAAAMRASRGRAWPPQRAERAIAPLR